MTQPVELDLDHLITQLSRDLERALVAARRAAQQRTARRVQAARASGQATAVGGDRQTQDLASRHQLEALAARWAAADALRGLDPVGAAAWDTRVTATGVDLAKVHRESDLPAGSPGLGDEHGRGLSDSTGVLAEQEPNRAVIDGAPHNTVPGLDAGAPRATIASDLIVEHLTEAYTDEGLDAAAEPAPASTVGGLIAATHPDGGSPTPPTSTVTDDAAHAAEFTVARSMDQELGHGPEVGVQR